jgi:hypothetical protein
MHLIYPTSIYKWDIHDPYNYTRPILSRALASRPRKEGKVEGSQLRLYKAKEGSKKHEAAHA